MTRLRGVLLLCALALVRARWVLVFWPNFDVSMPSCAVDGVSVLELSYDELACGHELSASCYPPTCTDACKDDADCEFVVAKTNALTGGGVCEFRCKEHLLEDYDMVPRLGYTTFQLTNEEEIIAMDLDINDVTFLNSSLSPGHTLLIVLAACALVGSVVVSLCTRTARTCTLPEPLQSYVEEGRSRYGAMLGFGPDGSFIGFGTAASSPSRSSRFLSMFGFGTAAPSPPPSMVARASFSLWGDEPKATPAGFNLWGDEPEPVATPVKSKKAPVFVPEVEAPRSGEGSPNKGYIRTASGYIYNSISGRKASVSPGQGGSSLY